MEENNTKIFVATRKEININLPQNYEIIQAGTIETGNLSYKKDNTGENISQKNPFYCELTVLYWIWKNKKNDIIGLTHHRRFFFNEQILPKIVSVKKIEKILQTKDIILPTPISVGKGVEFQYKKAHIAKDYDLCRETIEKEVSEFLPFFDQSSTLPFLYPYNMLITKREILNDYCSFLFPILEKLEEKIDYENYDSYQKRVFGFLAERLFQVWVLKNKQNLNSQELPVYNTEQSIIRQKYFTKQFSRQRKRQLT